MRRGGRRRPRWRAGRARAPGSAPSAPRACGRGCTSADDRVQQQARVAPARERRDPAHDAQLPAGCCARAGAPSRWAARCRRRPSSAPSRAGEVGARDLAAGDSCARRSPTRQSSARAPRRKSIDSAAPGPTGARNLTTARRGALPTQAASVGSPQRRLEHLGEQRDAGQQRLARESGRRTPDGRRDLDRCARRRSRSSPRRPAAGAPRARRARPASACRSARAAARRRGRCGAAGTPRRRARASAATIALARDARRDDEGDQADDAGRVAVALGRHPERAVDDAFDRVQVEVQVADRAALAGDVDRGRSSGRAGGRSRRRRPRARRRAPSAAARGRR